MVMKILNLYKCNIVHTADTVLLKMFPVKILLKFGNYFRTLQLGF